MTDEALLQQLEDICGQLRRLDEAIRGNGKPGLNTRVDRLEQAAVRQSKLVWLIVGATVVTAISSIASVVTG